MATEWKLTKPKSWNSFYTNIRTYDETLGSFATYNIIIIIFSFYLFVGPPPPVHRDFTRRPWEIRSEVQTRPGRSTGRDNIKIIIWEEKNNKCIKKCFICRAASYIRRVYDVYYPYIYIYRHGPKESYLRHRQLNFRHLYDLFTLVYYTIDQNTWFSTHI